MFMTEIQELYLMNTLRIYNECRRKRVIFKITNSIWTPQTFLPCLLVERMDGWMRHSLNKKRGRVVCLKVYWNWREFLIRDHLVTQRAIEDISFH